MGSLTPAFLAAQKRVESLRNACLFGGGGGLKVDKTRSGYITHAF